MSDPFHGAPPCLAVTDSSFAVLTGLAPRFEALAGEIIDGFAASGRCEFAGDFAAPYSARVLALLLGLPGDEWPVIAREAAALGFAPGAGGQPGPPRAEAARQTLSDYAGAAIADRRARPRDDFMTALVRAHDDSADNEPEPPDGPAADELRDAVVRLIVGGYDATRHQLGLAMAAFLRRPGQWDLLARDPGLAGQAVEEVLRVAPAVHLSCESAGHLLARCYLGAALPVLARRLRDPRPLPGGRWLPGPGGAGPTALPIAFTPEA